MKRRILAGLVAGLMLTGCASAGSTDGPRRSRDIISQEEIAAAGQQIQTAMDAVQTLRPHFLRERSNATAGVAAARVDPVVVYVNGVRRGLVNELSRIRADQVEQIRYVRPSDAQTRYGMNHGSGAIELTLIGGA